MSIADQFNPSSDAGFVRASYASQARRQFQVSLALVCILAVAAAAVALSMWFEAGAAATVPGAGPASLAAWLIRMA